MKKLLFHAFLASFFIMFIEIIGAKLLTPILGGSHVIWITQILITLISLAIGSLLAVKISSLKYNGYLLIGSGLYLLLMINSLNYIVNIFQNYSLISLSLLLAILLYSLPLISLAMVFPCVANDIHNKHQNSFHIGHISFVSTIGSVLGTLSTYYCIVLTSNYNLLVFSSIGLVLFGILLTSSFKSINKYPLFLLLGIQLFFQYNQKRSENSYLHYENTHFGEIILKKEQNSIVIYNDRLVQNGFNNEKQSIHLFTYALTRLPLMYNEPKNALILGLGIGLTAQELQSKNVEVEAIEINQSMINLAKKYTNIDKVKIHYGDSRYVIRNIKNKFDLIIHDCFLVDSVPKYLLTKEALIDIKSKLTENGILSINSFGTLAPNDYLTDSTYSTLKQVFNHVKVYSLNNYNIFFIASRHPLISTNNIYLNDSPLKIQNELMILSQSEIKDFNKVDIMTDSNSSIEFLDNSHRELFRRNNSL